MTRLSTVLAVSLATASPAAANMDGKNCDNAVNGPSNCDSCLTIDNRPDGATFCVKDGKGLTKKQIDAWYAEEGKKMAARALSARFPFTPEQYSRTLQMMKAKGIFSKYTHSCEMQTDGTGYLCQDSLDRVSIMYYANTESDKINHIAVASDPSNIEKAASVAAFVVLSNNEKYQQISSESELTMAFASTHNTIQKAMDRIFVVGGSSTDMIGDDFILYQLSADKSAAVASISP